nr:uncharacterized protein LOC116156577 [Camelus dromedarius]
MPETTSSQDTGRYWGTLHGSGYFQSSSPPQDHMMGMETSSFLPLIFRLELATPQTGAAVVSPEFSPWTQQPFLLAEPGEARVPGRPGGRRVRGARRGGARRGGAGAGTQASRVAPLPPQARAGPPHAAPSHAAPAQSGRRRRRGDGPAMAKPPAAAAGVPGQVPVEELLRWNKEGRARRRRRGRERGPAAGARWPAARREPTPWQHLPESRCLKHVNQRVQDAIPERRQLCCFLERPAQRAQTGARVAAFGARRPAPCGTRRPSRSRSCGSSRRARKLCGARNWNSRNKCWFAAGSLRLWFEMDCLS